MRTSRKHWIDPGSSLSSHSHSHASGSTPVPTAIPAPPPVLPLSPPRFLSQPWSRIPYWNHRPFLRPHEPHPRPHMPTHASICTSGVSIHDLAKLSEIHSSSYTAWLIVRYQVICNILCVRNMKGKGRGRAEFSLWCWKDRQRFKRVKCPSSWGIECVQGAPRVLIEQCIEYCVLRIRVRVLSQIRCADLGVHEGGQREQRGWRRGDGNGWATHIIEI
jgi:hypothetical protein